MSRPKCTFPSKVRPAAAAPPRFGSHAVNKCSFHGLFSDTFFAFLLVNLPFKIVPKCNAHVLSRVPKIKRAVMCSVEEASVFSKLYSGIT